MSCVSTLRIRFSDHITEEYQEGLFAELAEVFGTTATHLAEGEFEIGGFRKSKAAGLLAQLEAEEAAGRLRLLHTDE